MKREYQDERMKAIIARTSDAVTAFDFVVISDELDKARREETKRVCAIIDEAISQIHAPLLVDEQHELLSNLKLKIRNVA